MYWCHARCFTGSAPKVTTERLWRVCASTDVFISTLAATTSNTFKALRFTAHLKGLFMHVLLWINNSGFLRNLLCSCSARHVRSCLVPTQKNIQKRFSTWTKVTGYTDSIGSMALALKALVNNLPCCSVSWREAIPDIRFPKHQNVNCTSWNTVSWSL